MTRESRMKIFFRALLLYLFVSPFVAHADTWQAESGERQIALLELFTAEGCGLCPAADRWVHQLPDKGIDESNLIVLGFHIDYLNDEKGWVDKFARLSYSDRQRQLARINLYQTIYTPEFVLSGEVVHTWRKHIIDVIQVVNKISPDAAISLSALQQQDSLIINTKIAVTGDENRKFSQLYLAVTENNIISKVSGGDNAGATFNHQNLVREWLGPFTLDGSGVSEVSQQLKIHPEWDLEQMNIVALVQNLDDGFVLQALKLPLSNKTH